MFAGSNSKLADSQNASENSNPGLFETLQILKRSSMYQVPVEIILIFYFPLFTEYSAEKLHKQVMLFLEKVCLVWLNTFPEFQITGKVPTVSYHAIKNTRRKMEDRHVMVPDLNALFGITVKIGVLLPKPCH